jgi:hypothetical protein
LVQEEDEQTEIAEEGLENIWDELEDRDEASDEEKLKKRKTVSK